MHDTTEVLNRVVICRSVKVKEWSYMLSTGVPQRPFIGALSRAISTLYMRTKLSAISPYTQPCETPLINSCAIVSKFIIDFLAACYKLAKLLSRVSKLSPVSFNAVLIIGDSQRVNLEQSLPNDRKTIPFFLLDMVYATAFIAGHYMRSFAHRHVTG